MVPSGVELNCAIISYCGRGQTPDASNLYEAPQDALQRAGIISNDYWIRTHEGSNRLRDEANPRVEIILSVAAI
jgi:Holliday junction resolvase RusA-like endonuclease